MKNFLKLSAAVTLGLTVVISACKKNEVTAPRNNTNKTDFALLSKQVAMNFYKAINGGSDGFKASGATSRKVNAAAPQCGDVVVTPNYYQTQSGDTTRLVTGNSVFTYLCNNNILDEYKLADTTSTKETYPGYESIYTTIQGYNTRAINADYSKSYSTGKISASYIQRKFSNNVTVDSLAWATNYNLQVVEVTRVNNEAVVSGGVCDFTSRVYHKDNGDDINGWSEDHYGFIAFQGNDTFKVAFGNSQGFYSEYLVNIKTGATVKL